MSRKNRAGKGGGGLQGGTVRKGLPENVMFQQMFTGYEGVSNRDDRGTMPRPWDCNAQILRQ